LVQPANAVCPEVESDCHVIGFELYGGVILWQSSCRAGVFRLGSKRRAFSLVELLITLVLMIILTTIMWSRGSGSRQRQLKQACESNLLKCYIALQIYNTDNGGKLPFVPNAQTSEVPLSLLVPHYSVDTTIFTCPGSKDSALPSGESFAGRRISYAYYMGQNLTNTMAALMSDRQVDTQSKTEGQFIFSTTGKPPGDNHHKFGGNILFADGRVEYCSPKCSSPLVLTPGVVLLNPKP
jgi:prepilin-type processing-associated H-X9-DG protein